jgi:hypothetical protein
MDYRKCDHDFYNNICRNCGLVIEIFFEDLKDGKNINSPNPKTSILDELTGIPPDIIAKVRQNISKKQNSTGKKARNDRKTVFFLLYEAFLQKECPDFDPDHIAKQLNLKKKEINCCLRSFSQTSLVPHVHEGVTESRSIVIINPVAHVKNRCKLNGIEEYEDEIRAITKNIIEKKDILLSSRPVYVICAIIKKFCESKKINIKGFGKHNDISDNALKKITLEIEEFF